MNEEARRIALSAVVLGLFAALVVWWLEEFNRKRLVADWHAFVEGWAAERSPDA